MMARSPNASQFDPAWRRMPARGSNGDLRIFAARFLVMRFEGFRKDIAICLTAVPSSLRPGEDTHAYFPAIMSCCSTFEYVAGLLLGNADDPVPLDHWALYARRFMPEVYSRENVRILQKMFRHKIAHHGITSGIWVDGARRYTWTVSERPGNPAMKIEELAQGSCELVNDTPWPTPVTHRVTIGIATLAEDIENSVLGLGGYIDALFAPDGKDLERFRKCMQQLYPT